MEPPRDPIHPLNHPRPLSLQISPGVLLQLGLHYLPNHSDRDYIRRTLPGLQQTIGYADYLANKRSKAAKLALKKSRTWKDSTGKFSVKATLVEIADGKAVLEKEGNKIIRVPLKQLSDDDQTLLKKAFDTIVEID